jgi:myo-inositol 2-dehydrogenase/D-chiro-inositol 1-dehydrogenase
MGAGRIGKMHAKIISAHPNAKLKYVYDVNKKFANDVARLTECKIASKPEEAINSKEIDAVLIASATPTHTKFITMAAKAGKAIFCEKPIDLDINKVNDCMESIKGTNVPIQIGFNRRFDASHAKAQQARVKKEIGELEMVVITSRDPEPPGIEYLKAAGGFFRDTTIHDFDLTRFILGDDPVVQISAFGDALFDKNSQQVKDLDTAMFILKSKKGVLIHINNSRRAVYGYDQRVEVFGSKGMVISNNQTPTSLERYTNTSTNEKEPIHFFFIERYEQAYRDQFNEFVKCVEDKSKTFSRI